MASAPPPSSTSLISHASSPDDEPTIHSSLQRYITSLPDTHTTYTRFFSALLIPTPSHPQFFNDLRDFRSQPLIISLLAPGTSENYRLVTRNFVSSRFAHPWCRVQSDFNGGWHRASWTGGNAKAGEKARKEEDRLHRLLVPIWIAMRRRMVPGDEVVRAWNVKEDERVEEAAKLKAESALEAKSATSEDSSAGVAATTTVYPELGFAIRDGSGPSTSTASRPAESPDPEQAATASKMLLGVAVTGFILSDKRVSKYLHKKLKKK